MNRYVSRRSYTDEPGLLEQVYVLLDTAFPGLSAHARSLEPAGLRWDRVSTPFLLTEGDEVLSHVGILEVPMVIDGREVLIGGVHAVCTHPDHRRLGYYRAVMTEAMTWCDQRYTTLMLIAGQAELYEPFGFRLIPETRFTGPVQPSAEAAQASTLRPLALGRPDDLRLLHRLLDERAPVSQRLGVVRERAVFLFNQADQALWYAEDLDALLCYHVREDTLCLYDIVAPRMPTLQQVIDRIDAPAKRVEVYFAPDQLDASLAPEPHVLDGDSLLMVRGHFPGSLGDVMLPPSARF